MKKERSIVLGIGIGTAIGVLTDNLGLWISLGVAIGSGIESKLMNKNKR